MGKKAASVLPEAVEADNKGCRSVLKIIALRQPELPKGFVVLIDKIPDKGCVAVVNIHLAPPYISNSSKVFSRGSSSNSPLAYSNLSELRRAVTSTSGF